MSATAAIRTLLTMKREKNKKKGSIVVGLVAFWHFGILTLVF